MKPMWKYAVSGMAAGAANGLFGAGGGMILVPLLTRWGGLEDKTALAVLPLTMTRSPSQASLATVRRLISRDTFKYLSSRIAVPQQSFAPAGIASSSIRRFSLSSFSADSSIPQDSRPIIFLGARLVQATRVLPTSSSG